VPVIQIKLVPTQGAITGNGYELPFSKDYEVPRENICIGTSLGKGHFGCVYQAQVKDLLAPGVTSIVAVKMLQEGYTDRDMMDLIREMEVMKIIGKHENIVNLLGCCTADGELLVIIECALLGSLDKYLKSIRQVNGDGEIVQRNSVDLDKLVKELVNYAWQIARGMEYLASKKVTFERL
jgi:serine/threonine protein kinase